MTVTPIESTQQFDEVIKSGKVFLIHFWATWCGACRVISPILEQFSKSEEFANIGFYKVDVDAQDEISQEVGITAMPTFIFFKDGKKVEELVGANPQGLEQLIRQAASLAT